MMVFCVTELDMGSNIDFIAIPLDNFNNMVKRFAPTIEFEFEFFDSGVLCANFTIINDDLLEFDETFSVNLETFSFLPPGVLSAQNSTSITIVDDEGITIMLIHLEYYDHCLLIIDIARRRYIILY